jgi:hypothetical protein
MPLVELEHTAPVFERAKTVLALEREATDREFRRVSTGLLSSYVAGTGRDVTLDHRVDAVGNVVTWLLHTDTN